MKAVAIVAGLACFTLPLAAMVASGYIEAGQALTGLDSLYEAGALLVSVALPVAVLVAALAVMGSFALIGTLIERAESRWREGRG